MLGRWECVRRYKDRRVSVSPRARLRRPVRHAGHGAGRVVLAAGPEVAADLRGFAKGHADARGAEEGVGGAVVFAEVEVHVGAWLWLVFLGGVS